MMTSMMTMLTMMTSMTMMIMRMGKLVAQVAGGGGVSEAQPKRLRTRLESLADYVPHQHSP